MPVSLEESAEIVWNSMVFMDFYGFYVAKLVRFDTIKVVVVGTVFIGVVVVGTVFIRVVVTGMGFIKVVVTGCDW